MDLVADAFARHQRIAFQFSGGRDSTAALYLLRPYWNRMRVYHIDASDQFPELRAVVERVAQDIPMTVITTDAKAIRREHGLPTDIVPFDNTTVGRALSGAAVHLQGRMECCWKALMDPLHRRMLEDGMTLLVRGVRNDEFAALPVRSGHVEGTVELLYPIEDWTANHVMEYLRALKLPYARFYEEGMHQAPECMGCTAWWDEGRSRYMRRFHPQAYSAVRDDMRVIRGAIDHQLAKLDDKENDHG